MKLNGGELGNCSGSDRRGNCYCCCFGGLGKVEEGKDRWEEGKKRKKRVVEKEQKEGREKKG